MTNNTKQAKEGTIKLATPVPFVGLEHKDLVAVSLEDLVEAQKEHEREVEQARLEVIERVEKEIEKLPRESHDFGWGDHEWIDTCKIWRLFRNLKKEIKEE